MKRLILLYILFVGASVSSLNAQHELGLHFMDTVFQSNFTNPAFGADKGRTTAMLPSAYFNFSSPYSAAQLAVEQDGKKVINAQSAHKVMNPVSHFTSNIDIQTVGLAFGFNRLNVNFYHKMKSDIHLNISKDFMGAAAYGNSAYLGKTMDIGSGVTGQLYSEMGLGAAYKVNDKLSVGFRIKRLAGFAAISTHKQKATLFTDSINYNLTVNTDFDIRTYDLNRFENIANGNFVFSEIYSSDNNGFSFDLGATYTLGKWRFDASVIDLAGAINWRNGAKTYSSSGTYTYSGEKTTGFLSFDQMHNDGMQDTVKKILNVVEGTTGESKIKLPMKSYVGAQYDLNSKIRLGGLFYVESWDGITKMDVMLNSTFRFGKAMHVGVNYAVRNGTFDNLGGHLTLNLGALQIYGLTDNFISVFNKTGAKSMNTRLGVNLVF